MIKNNRIFIICLLVVVLTLMLYGCGSSPRSQETENTTQTQSSDNIETYTEPTEPSQSEDNLKTFTKQELEKYDGQNGNPAYIAVNGKVYDVSNVIQWKNGTHHGFNAGDDLTEAMNDSPHTLSVLDNLPVVGKLTQ